MSATETDTLELVLFASDPALVSQALAAGIRSFIVDWEWRGKDLRQLGFDTEINRDTAEDLRRLAELGAPRRFCRLNRFGPWSGDEVEEAVSAGATDLLLPMVESPGEVASWLEMVGGRCASGILVETTAGVAAAARLATLPLAHVYVGLNDLAIDRRSASLFEAVVDGTVESLAARFTGRMFGFGGLTVVDRGAPIPCRLLLAEMARLGCGFTFLRRSFRRDIVGRDMPCEVASMRELWKRCRARSVDAQRAEHDRLVDAVRAAVEAAR